MDEVTSPRPSGACTPALCRAIEKAGHCTMRYAVANQVTCTPGRLRKFVPAELVGRLNNCSMCDFHRHVYIIRRRAAEPLPRLPSRRFKSYLCATEDEDAPLLPPPRAQLAAHYQRTAHALQERSFASCACNAVGSGDGIKIQGRRLPEGLAALNGLCAHDGGAASSVRGTLNVQIGAMTKQQRQAGGGKHMVMPGTVRRPGGGTDAVVLRAALPRGWGLPGFSRQTPRVLRCKGGFSRAHCEPHGWKAFERTCHVHLGVRTLAEYMGTEYDDLFGAGGKDFAMGASLQGVPGWPRLVGAGCCALPVSDVEAKDGQVDYVPLPVEAREALVTDDPTPRPTVCESGSLSRAACVRAHVLASLQAMHALTEVHHATFDEHVEPRHHVLMDDQWCYHPHDNRVVACDTDFVHLWDAHAWAVPRSYTTALSRRPRTCGPNCRIRRFYGLPPEALRNSHSGAAAGLLDVQNDSVRSSAEPPPTGMPSPGKTLLVDLPLAMSRSLLTPAIKELPLLAPLVRAVEQRHAALVAGDASIRQLTFSCMGAWLRAATREM